MSGFRVGALLAGVAIFGGSILTILCTTTISPGYAGVIYNRNGGIEEQTLGQGWHMVSPLKSVIEYPVSTENVYLTKGPTEGSENDDSFNVSTREGKPVNVDVMYSFHMDQTNLPHIFTKFKGAAADIIEKGFIKQQIKGTIQEITSMYGVMDIYGEKRGEITKKIEDALTEKGSVLHDDGIIIETFAFGEIRPDEASMKAIQDKVNAQQKLQQIEIEKQQAEILAQKARIEAQGNADAQLIEAEGRAEANAKLQSSISAELIEYEKAKKWDGKLPTYTGVGNPMITIK